MHAWLRISLVLLGLIIVGRLDSKPALAAGTVGNGTPASCTGNALQTALNGGGTVRFNCGAAVRTINAGTYVISQNTTIIGGDKVILSGENLRQLFIVNSGATLNLRSITLKDGTFTGGGCVRVNGGGSLTTISVTFESCESETNTGDGGAIYNLGSVTADFTIFRSNLSGDDGGAIYNGSGGTVTIRDSYFRSNDAESGGGIHNLGTLTIRRTLFETNRVTGFGGGINQVLGTLDINNSTFFDNLATQGGGIFADGGSVSTISFSTFYRNRANTGGGIRAFNNTAQVNLSRSILAGSRDVNDTFDTLECDGPSLLSGGYNIIEDGSCVSGSNATDQRNTNPLLGNLADNGGFTRTALPTASSPANSFVPTGQCTVDFDQRRATRPKPCDSGAAERGGLLPKGYLPLLRKP